MRFLACTSEPNTSTASKFSRGHRTGMTANVPTCRQGACSAYPDRDLLHKFNQFWGESGECVKGLSVKAQLQLSPVVQQMRLMLAGSRVVTWVYAPLGEVRAIISSFVRCENYDFL